MHRTLPVPSIDEKNPLYCPSISAADYLRSLCRRDKRRSKSNQKYRVQSFAKILERSVLTDARKSSGDLVDSNGRRLPTLTLPVKITTRNAPSPRIIAGSSDDTPGFAYSIPAWEHETDEEDYDSPLPTAMLWVRTMRNQPVSARSLAKRSVRVRKRKRDASFADIRGPPKYAKSIESVLDRSFDVTIRPEKLCYSDFLGTPKVSLPVRGTRKDTGDLQLRIKDLEDQLYGPWIGTESPRTLLGFLGRLETMLPGVRLKERLADLGDLSHQSIVDLLAKNGFLNASVLDLFRSSEVQRIVLTESLCHANGLNLSANDVLPVFSKPSGFPFLSELSFTGARICDSDLVHIQHLPKLSTLLLNNAGISNEGVFLLVSLKRSLVQLTLAFNPAIDDDAVPALLLLSKLSFLSILDTGIGMVGLRRLARTIFDEDRIIDIEIPTVCEEYVQNMHKQYAINPRPPLITNPKLCAHLSAAALQRNLAAHALENQEISSEGTKKEMMDRLTALLEIRKMDMLVRDMILGNDRDVFEVEE